MREMVTTVGPLIASSATKIGASQKAAVSGSQYLVLNGAATDAAATAVCAAQTPAGAGALTINGTLATGGVAYLPQPRRIYLTCVGNESGNTFTITGTVFPSGVSRLPATVTETITGANASLVSSQNLYSTISSVSTSGAGAANISVGMGGVATLDAARQVLITDGGNDTGVTFTISGTDWAGTAISEKVTGVSGSTVASQLSYLTVTSVQASAAVATTVSLGTNGVASSPWVCFDQYAGTAPTAIQVNGTGTVNWTVQQTLDDPNSVSNPVALASMTWVNHPDTSLVASAVTTGVQGNYAYAPVWARLMLNSGTGSATAKFVQAGLFS